MSMHDYVERMDPAELRTIREYLGLTRDDLAGALSVREDTVRKWEAGREPIPYRVLEEVERLEVYTANAVALAVDGLESSRDPMAVVYRTDADLRTQGVVESWCTARWWRHVVARAAHEVPGVPVTYAGT